MPPPSLQALAGLARPAVEAGDATWPLPPGLDRLVPALRRGTTVSVQGAAPGATSVALALLAGAMTTGGWGAIAGCGAAGLAAAWEAGVALQRLVLVPDVKGSWEVVAALVGGTEAVVVGPSSPPTAGDARLITARVRKTGALFIYLGPWPDRAEYQLKVVDCRWRGAPRGRSGPFGARTLEVFGRGRGMGGIERRAEFPLLPSMPARFGQREITRPPQGT